MDQRTQPQRGPAGEPGRPAEGCTASPNRAFLYSAATAVVTGGLIWLALRVF